jgi:hypothetical protein
VSHFPGSSLDCEDFPAPIVRLLDDGVGLAFDLGLPCGGLDVVSLARLIARVRSRPKAREHSPGEGTFLTKPMFFIFPLARLLTYG